MASQMIHMEVGYRVAEQLNLQEAKKQLILGSVAPDAVHFADDYLPKKIHSHLFENCGPWGDTQDYENWIVNIKAFWDKYVVNENDISLRMFYIGIVIHCLTDYWNDLLIWRALQKKMIPPMTYDSFKEAYYPESHRIDRWLYQNSSNAKEIMTLLKESEESDFDDYLRAAWISQMKDHLINVQYNLPEPIDVSNHIYYPSDMMLWFVDEVPKRICAQLKEWGNIYGEQV